MISKNLIIKNSLQKKGFSRIYLQYPWTSISKNKYYVRNDIAVAIKQAQLSDISLSELLRDICTIKQIEALISLLKTMGAIINE